MTAVVHRRVASDASLGRTSRMATKLWTAEEVAQLPDDGFRYALIQGVLYRNPLRTARQGRCVATVGRHVSNFVVLENLGVVYGPCGFVLERDPDTLLEPDMAFLQSARIPTDEDTYPELAPNLVVEVAAPSQTNPSIEQKTALYLSAGVRLIWTVDPVWRTIRARRPDGTDRLLTEGDELDGEDVLPGFCVPVA